MLATAHDVAREHRLISAVGQVGLPVPAALGVCTDASVNDQPFYVMDFVDGVVLDSVERGRDVPPEIRRRVGESLFDTLAELHAIDVDAVGLGDLAKRDGYIERQIKRWTTQWEQTTTHPVAAVEVARATLAERIPDQGRPTIVHGDFRLGNCITDPSTGRIAAVLDWELCTLGDPLADVGYIGVYWDDEGLADIKANDPTGAGGFGRYRDLVDRYEQRTGRDCSNVEYYTAFSCWRLAVITQGVYARFLHGAMGNQEIDLDNAATTVARLAERACALLGVSPAR